MSMLGLNSEPTKDDNLFQRLFWPSNHPGEVDTLGQQGFWVCVIVGLISALITAFQGHPLVALLVIVFYWLGGVGVREHSVAAAVLVAAGYIIGLLMALLMVRMPGILDILLCGLLLANIRGTWIASKWSRLGDPNVFPERQNRTFFDMVVDQWPPRIWPIGKFVFYAVSTLYFALLILGTLGFVALRMRAMRPHPQTLQQAPAQQLPAQPASR